METFIIAIAWWLVSWITRMIQKRYDISSRLVLLWIAVVAWILYQIFITFLPKEMQATVVEFVMWTIWSALAIHEFIWRPLVDGESIRLDVDVKQKDDDLYGWCYEKEDEEAWILGAENRNQPRITLSDLPKARRTFSETKIQYNQTKEIGKNTCTLAASMWAISDLMARRYKPEEMKEILESAKKKWFDHDRWWYTEDATNHVRLMTNKLWGTDLIRLSFLMSDSDTVNKVQSLGYSIVVGYRGGKGYNQDRDSDGSVTEIHLDNTYWHLVRMYWRIIDNYFWKKYNVYSNLVIKNMLQKGTWHKYGYIFVNPNDIADKAIFDRIKAFQTARAQTQDYLLLMGPIVTWPKWVDKSANRKTDSSTWIVSVMYTWEWHQIVK